MGRPLPEDADGNVRRRRGRAAEDASVPVVAYDRPIDAEGTDYYIAFDNFKVGQLQGTALLEGLAKLKGEGPYNIELFAGAATDANAARQDALPRAIRSSAARSSG